MVALSVFRKSRANSIIARSRRFSINWINHSNEKLRAAILELGNSFSESVLDKLQEVGVDYGLEGGVPVIKGSMAFELCQVERKYREGDHDLFIASVEGARAYDDFVKYWRFRSYKPIFYLGSNRRKQDRVRSF
jgi:flavin reductase (DIM6/NTAB) family NADH-FMN oxidoreductase RutF